MMKMNLYHYKIIYVVTIISILFTASGLRAQDRTPAAEALSEGTKEFLSDPARTGSLLGSILAGAAVANPLAPLLGSVAGFMIGKSSAFTNKDSSTTRRQAYDKRSLIPDDGHQVTSLTGLTGKLPQASEQQGIVGFSRDSEPGKQSERTQPIILVESPGEIGLGNQPVRTEPIVIVELPDETGMGNQLDHTVALGLNGMTGEGSDLQKQLAQACRNVQITEPLSSSCYYYSQ